MKYRLIAGLALAIVVSSATADIPIQASLNQNTVTPPAKRLWNLQNADIYSVIEAVSRETQKNFIVDPKVQGNITIVSSQPIDSKGVYQVFLSALQVLGYSAVPYGDMIKIVPDVNAKQMGTPIATNRRPGKGDENVVRIIPVKHVSAIQLVPILRPLMSNFSKISSYNPTNSLIMAGHAKNINRLAKIIRRVDQPDSDTIEIITLQHTNATKITEVLKQLQSADKINGKLTNISIVADDQSNSILLSGNRNERLRMRVIISQLDTAGPQGNTEVIYLNYLKAKDLAPTLSKIALSAYTNNSVHSSSTRRRNGSSNAKEVSVQAEPNSNAIIVSAPPSLMSTIKNVVHDLDVQPSQVLVEAVIAQVTETQSKDLGIAWGSLPKSSSGNNSVASNFQSGVGIIQAGSIQAVITALSGHGSADILSTPSITVLDNHKAKISVGKDVSVQNRVYAATTDTTDNSTTPFATFSYKKVALELNVTPQISPNNSVQLDIKQTNDTLQNPTDVSTTPTINTNNIETSVRVNSGDILVLGGLISHDLERTDSKIPILGDIPFIGKLFTTKNANTEKKNLMVFLKPIILRDNNFTKNISKQHYDTLRKLQLKKRRGQDILGSHDEPPLMSSYNKNQLRLPAPFSK